MMACEHNIVTKSACGADPCSVWAAQLYCASCEIGEILEENEKIIAGSGRNGCATLPLPWGEKAFSHKAH